MNSFLWECVFGCGMVSPGAGEGCPMLGRIHIVAGRDELEAWVGQEDEAEGDDKHDPVATEWPEQNWSTSDEYDCASSDKINEHSPLPLAT